MAKQKTTIVKPSKGRFVITDEEEVYVYPTQSITLVKWLIGLVSALLLGTIFYLYF